jgi:hypothetical protein
MASLSGKRAIEAECLTRSVTVDWPLLNDFALEALKRLESPLEKTVHILILVAIDVNDLRREIPTATKGMRVVDTDREFSANSDRQASATNSVSFLGLCPPKACKTVSFFVSFHRGATQSGILFLVSVERGTSRRVYHRPPWLSECDTRVSRKPCCSFERG